MTKHILPAFILMLLFSSVGFSSNGNANRLAIPSGSGLQANSTITAELSYAIFSMPNNGQLNNTLAPGDPSQYMPLDTTKKSVKKVVVKPKNAPPAMGNPYRPKELLSGIEKAKNGDLKGAIMDFDSCIRKNYKNYNAYFYKAKALIELNDPKNALTNINLAIQYEDKNPVYYFYRGKLLYDAGSTDKAYLDFDKAVTLNPRFAEALNYRGVTKEVIGKHTEAIEDYKAAIAVKPDFGMAYYNKGTSEAALELFKEASASFSKAVELDPKNVLGFLNRGNCYVMLKDYTLAIADYSSAIALDPENADAYYNRGAAAQLAGDKSSCNDWQKALTLGSKKAGEALKEYCK